MARLFRALTGRFARYLALVIALSIVIWLFGDRLVLQGWQPLGDPVIRMLVILGLFAALFAWQGWRLWRIRRLNRRMVNGLLETEGLSSMSDGTASEEELDILRERFETAMQVLRSNAVSGKRGRRFVYELPFYIIIGPPGSGKTTILRNSGLEFPLADRLGVDAVQGLGGTRNCDWWFADDAVLIDTAGRYTTQDVNATVDRAAWRGFLDLLKTYRRQCPVNGVMVTISLSDVLLADDAQLEAHVAAMRARLQEVMRAFGMRVPVYVLITKCDLIPGFAAFFDDLDEAARRQVWGMTFSEQVGKSPADAARAFFTEFDGLIGQITGLLPKRMHEERNVANRRLIFGFPGELLQLRPVIGAFLADVFRDSRYEMPAQLRGVYFTSGTQEGTPIDRLLGTLSASFGLGTRALPAFSGRGKAFFIHQVLSDVIFPEADLAGGDRRYARVLFWIQAGTATAALAVISVLGALWYAAYESTGQRLDALDVAVDQYRQSVANVPPNPDIFERTAPIAAADQIAAVFDANDIPPLLAQGGLTAESTLRPLAERAADRVLLQELWIGLYDLLEQQLRDSLTSGTGDDFRRESLRHYLMMAQPDRMDQGSFRNWVRLELRRQFPLQPDRHEAVLGYLDRAQALGAPAFAVDQGLVDRARGALVQIPLPDQVYQRLQAEANRAGLPAFDPGRLLRVGGREVMISQAGFGLYPTIPGFYTADGFYDFFIPRLPDAARGEFRADWVLGDQAAQASANQIAEVTRQVADLYVSDYVQFWEQLIGQVGVAPLLDLPDALRKLELLSGPQSPLAAFLEAVQENTDLPPQRRRDGAPPAQGSGAGGLVQQAQAAADATQGALEDAAAQATAASAAAALQGNWPGTQIADSFRGLHDLVDASDGQTELSRVQDLLGRTYAQLRTVTTAPDQQQAAYDMAATRIQNGGGDAISDLQARAIRMPDPVRQMLRNIAFDSWGLLIEQARMFVDDAWQEQVIPACQRVIFRRYPIYRDSGADIPLSDFAGFFGRNGTIDTFFDTFLAPFVDTRGPAWRNTGLEGLTLGLDAAALEQFQRARDIRQNFFATAGGAPTLSFSLRPKDLDPQATRATLSIGDAQLDYRHEPPRTRPFFWPPDQGPLRVSVAITDLNTNSSNLTLEGPWAFLRFLDRVQVQSSRLSEAFELSVTLNGLTAVYTMTADSTLNAVTYRDVGQFRCPVQL